MGRQVQSERASQKRQAGTGALPPAPRKGAKQQNQVLMEIVGKPPVQLAEV